MQSYPEGTVADGPNGPIMFRGGQWVPVGGSGPQTIGAPKPGYQYEGPKAQADLANAQLESEAKRIAIEKARRELANTPDPDAPVTPTSKLSGLDYLKTLPPADAALTKSLAEGRMAFPTGAGLRSPYWQKALQNVANYDPTFDAVNYGARAATRKDFTSGKSAQNIKALNTAIGHVGQLYDQIGGTMSSGGYPLATTVNSLVNSYNRGAGSAGPTNYAQTAGAVASELTQVFRGTGGAEADSRRCWSSVTLANSTPMPRLSKSRRRSRTSWGCSSRALMPSVISTRRVWARLPSRSTCWTITRKRCGAPSMAVLLPVVAVFRPSLAAASLRSLAGAEPRPAVARLARNRTP